MTSRDATFSGLSVAVELKAIPTPTPIAKTLPKIARVVGLRREDVGGEVSRTGDLDLRFIVALLTLRELAGGGYNGSLYF